MPLTHSPRQNDLLAALSAASFEPLAAALELVPMRLGDMLYEPGVAQRHAYFPTTSVVSLYHIMASGASAESAGVGHEGVVGVSLFMGGETTISSAVVQTAGHGYRMHRDLLVQEFKRIGPMQGLLLRYTQALVAQICQRAACYRHHTIEQQLSCWLLSTLDRRRSAELAMTQELVAGMLGVRRESITQAVGHLQAAGQIRCRRGHISVIDEAGLRRSACECYAAVKLEMRRLLTQAPTLLPDEGAPGGAAVRGDATK